MRLEEKNKKSVFGVFLREKNNLLQPTKLAIKKKKKKKNEIELNGGNIKIL